MLKKDNHDSQIITSEEYLKVAERGAKGSIFLEIYGSWKWIHAELLAETIRKLKQYQSKLFHFSRQSSNIIFHRICIGMYWTAKTRHFLMQYKNAVVMLLLWLHRGLSYLSVWKQMSTSVGASIFA